MCNHFRHENPQRVEAFTRECADLVTLALWPPAANAWPKTQMPLLLQDGEKRILTSMRWGVWPFYEPKMPAKPVVNARDDKLLSGRLWPKAVATRRCLVPADSFMEWTGPDKAKWEVMFHLPEFQPFFFAGIWSKDPDGDGRGFAIITTSAHPVVAPLPHDRTPVLLDRRRALEWIGERELPQDRVTVLCARYEGELIRRDLQPTRPITKSSLGQGEINLG